MQLPANTSHEAPPRGAWQEIAEIMRQEMVLQGWVAVQQVSCWPKQIPVCTRALPHNGLEWHMQTTGFKQVVGDGTRASGTVLGHVTYSQPCCIKNLPAACQAN